jgi:DNA mismatch endonuclease (patch repair protein)
VFRRQRVAVFVDGCFWHGCPRPKHAPLPKNRAEWWAAKLGRNRLRARLVIRTLKRQGWRVLRVWECELRATGWVSVAGRVRTALTYMESDISRATVHPR